RLNIAACGRLFYTPSSPPHTLTTAQNTPQTHQRLNGQTKRRHDALRRWKIKSAPPPARSAFPASPARFMGRFECKCTPTSKTCQIYFVDIN
ncbi:hypothetical protein QSE78_000265, partial [Escherichia coli]